MKAWVLGDPDQLHLSDKPVPVPKRAEVLVRIDAVAICATDLEIIHSGSPAKILGGLPFNKNFTPGHEYMGTVVALGPGVDEFAIGERISVEIHAGCGQCKRCRQGMYTSCLNYGEPEQGPSRQRFHYRRRFRRIRDQSHQHAGAGARHHERRGSNACRHRGDVDVRPDRTRRAGRRRKRCRDRPRPDRAARGGGCKGARRQSRDPDGHARRAACDRQGARSGPRHQRCAARTRSRS